MTTQAKNLFVVCLLVVTANSRAADEPSADEILRAARMNQVGQSARLQAELRASDGERTPFVISLDGGQIRYSFESGEEIGLRMTDDEAVLTERSGGSESQVRPAKFDQRINNTPITYEDLAVPFLYWPRAKLNGEDKVYGRSSWEVEVQAPRGKSQYGVVRVWIDKDSGSIMRMEGYDGSGKLVKRFEVKAAQKLDGQWMLKEMRVERINPETRKPVERAYLVVKDKI